MATSAKKKTVKKKSKAASQKVPSYKRVVTGLQAGLTSYLLRRPHRSFRPTKKRDYARSLKLPGYWAFTHYVWRILWEHKSLFIGVIATYSIFTAVFIGIASQDTYTTLGDTLRLTGDQVFEGNWGEIGKASLLLLSGVTGSLNVTPNETQQLYGVFFGLMIWLTTVWLLRALLARQKPRFRDGLYNSGAAIIPTLMISLVLIVQLIPAAVATILATTAVSTGFVEGAIAMVFAVAGLLLFILSLYWIVSTVMALVIVTLPGMYPLQALRTAGDLTIGRRLRILYRWLWLGGVVLLLWVLILIPIIIFDSWLKGLIPAISWLPIVPVALLLMGSLTLVFSASYVYLLYRKVVEDDAKPA